MSLTAKEDSERNHPQFQKILKSLNEIPRHANDDIGEFPEIENIISKPHNDLMTEPISRPELDAKLETIEARMDGRLARIEDRFSSIDRQFGEMRVILAEQRTTAWKAAGAVIGVFVAVFAIYVASFDSGRETAKVAAQAQQHTSAALAEMRQIVESLKSAQQ